MKPYTRETYHRSDDREPAIKEEPDLPGAVATLLVATASAHLRLPAGAPERARLAVIATKVMKAHGHEKPCPAAAQRLVDEMIKLSVEDYYWERREQRT